MQFGAKSTLLGGSVISAYSDNGSMYYNPATMALKDSFSFGISANLYQLEFLTAKNALGPDTKMTSFNYNITPQLLSGSFELKNGTKLGVMYLSKNNYDILFQDSYQGNHNILTNYPSLKYYYVGDFTMRNRITEDWIGLSAAFKLGEKWSFGFAQFVQYHFQRFKQDISATAVSLDTLNSYTARFDYNREVQFDCLSTMTKVGVCFKPHKSLDMGLSICAPSFPIWGRGKTYTRLNFSNLQINNFESYSVFDRQKGLRANYNTPFSAAFGFRLSDEHFIFSANVEYFAQLDDYLLIDPNDTLNLKKKGIQYNSNDLIGVKKYAGSITNFAIGLEFKMTKSFSLIGSFRSDYNNQTKPDLNDDVNVRIATNYLDLWHAALGFNLNKNKKNFVVGFTYTFGEKKGLMQYANFKNPTDDTFLLYNVTKSAEFKYTGVSLILGVSF